MTLVDIFEHILDGFQFNNDKIDHILNKGENFVYNAIDKTLDFIK
jgi:hypothetical protein